MLVPAATVRAGSGCKTIVLGVALPAYSVICRWSAMAAPHDYVPSIFVGVNVLTVVPAMSGDPALYATI